MQELSLFLTSMHLFGCDSLPSFVFEGNMSAQYKQIGNAVPPLLGEAIGMEHFGEPEGGSA